LLQPRREVLKPKGEQPAARTAAERKTGPLATAEGRPRPGFKRKFIPVRLVLVLLDIRRLQLRKQGRERGRIAEAGFSTRATASGLRRSTLPARAPWRRCGSRRRVSGTRCPDVASRFSRSCRG